MTKPIVLNKRKKEKVRILGKWKIITNEIILNDFEKTKEKTLCTHLPTMNAKRFFFEIIAV